MGLVGGGNYDDQYLLIVLWGCLLIFVVPYTTMLAY